VAIGSGPARLGSGGQAWSVDLGTVRGEDIFSRAIPIVNETGRRVEFRTLGVSCGCTSPAIDRTVLGPGEIAQLTVRVSTGPAEESQTVLARIRGNIGGEPAQFDFHVSMRVAPVVGFSDDRFEIGLGNVSLGGAPISYDLSVARGPNPMKWDTLRVDCDSSQHHCGRTAGQRQMASSVEL
jgi:hypothetical protein